MSGLQTPRAWAAIDLLRFVCAMLVVVHHYGAVLPIEPNPAAAALLSGAVLPTAYADWTAFGWIGVELFFVISGYVIACSAAGADPAGFLRRRAQRLLPAAWVCASLTVATLIALEAGSASLLGMQWLRSVAFWPLGDAIDPSYWTLGIELAFYLLVAWRLRGGAEPARIERVAWWIGAASACFWLALTLTGQLGGEWLKERLPQLLLLTHGSFFAIGMLLQAGHREGFTRLRLAGIALFLLPATAEIVAHAIDNFDTLGAPRNFAAPLIAFGLGLAVIALCQHIQPIIVRWSGLATTLGLMTYPLYLLHQQIGAAIAGVLGRQGMSAEAGLATALAVSVGLSWAVVRFAEPIIRIGLARWLSAHHGLRRDNRPTASPSAG